MPTSSRGRFKIFGAPRKDVPDEVWLFGAGIQGSVFILVDRNTLLLLRRSAVIGIAWWCLTKFDSETTLFLTRSYSVFLQVRPYHRPVTI